MKMANNNNNNNNVQVSPEMGALTLVLLVNMYRNQMINLLVKNGVVVKDEMSDEQIAILMGNLLKVSKSFYNDLTAFLSNPKVIEKLAGGIEGMAEYFKMTGSGYLNAFGSNTELPTGIGYQSQYGLNLNTGSTSTNTSNQTTSKKGFFSDLNFGDLFSKSLNGFLTFNTNQANTKIAGYQSQIAQAGGYVPNINVPNGGNTNPNDNPKNGTSTTTIVVLSLLGVAVIGTIIYFVARPKK
jgi:hypothetical protein